MFGGFGGGGMGSAAGASSSGSSPLGGPAGPQRNAPYGGEMSLEEWKRRKGYRLACINYS